MNPPEAFPDVAKSYKCLSYFGFPEHIFLYVFYDHDYNLPVIIK